MWAPRALLALAWVVTALALWGLLREGEISEHASVSTLRMLLALSLSIAVAVAFISSTVSSIAPISEVMAPRSNGVRNVWRTSCSVSRIT